MIDCQPETQLTVLQPTRKHAGGRPPIYSTELASTICDHIRNGATMVYAAQAAGVDRDTLYEWNATKAEFSDMLARAEAEMFVNVSRTVVQASQGETKGDWRPAIELLKRRDRASWGDTLDIRKLDTADLVKLLDAQSTAQEMPAVTESGDELL